MQLILIDNDLFDVASRLRAVDDGYRVYYNKEKCRFEVHNVRQHGDTFCFAVPYDRLDARTVAYAVKTRICNADKIFAEVEKDNDVVAQSGYTKISSRAKEKK